MKDLFAPIGRRLAAFPLLTLLRRESDVPLRPLLLIVAVSALSNVFVLAIINQVAEQTSFTGPSTRSLVLFLLMVAIYNLSQRHVLVTAVSETEDIIARLRTRIARKVRQSNLESLETIGRAEIFNGVTRDSATLSNTAPMIVMGCQSSILIVFVTAYLAYLSVAAFLIATVLMVIALTLYALRSQDAFDQLRAASIKEYEFFNVLTDTLDGFKEAKLNAARGDEIGLHTAEVSQEVRQIKVDVMSRFAQLNVFGTSSFYLIIAAMVFVLPRFATPQSDVIMKSTAAILFLIGPLTAVANVLPAVTQASVAAMNISRIESALDAHASVESAVPQSSGSLSRRSFREIRLNHVMFEYRGPGAESTFRLGPLDLTLRSGETLLLVGGNGSGKSTLLRILTGLYTPLSGSLSLDDQTVDASSIDAYRSLFATVLADYHLFQRLYGLAAVSADEVNELLRQLEIADKTHVVDRRFTTLDLSTGQRKRVALAVALLEDRPIYVFDEWAAEQDAEFRERFYSRILPDLKAAGKTVVVVSHDDRYFNVPAIDRRLKLEQGQFVSA